MDDDDPDARPTTFFCSPVPLMCSAFSTVCARVFRVARRSLRRRRRLLPSHGTARQKIALVRAPEGEKCAQTDVLGFHTLHVLVCPHTVACSWRVAVCVLESGSIVHHLSQYSCHKYGYCAAQEAKRVILSLRKARFRLSTRDPARRAPFSRPSIENIHRDDSSINDRLQDQRVETVSIAARKSFCST